MAHDDKNNHIAVCAPRQILELKSSNEQQFFAVGACYTFKDDFRPLRKFRQEGELVDFEGITRKTESGALVYTNGMRQLGMSIDIRHE